MIPNYSLLGRSWDDPLLQRLIGSVDGILDEQGYSNYGGMDSGKSYFANLLRHQKNVQQKGCAYYQINEAKDMSSNATRRFVVGAYLQGRDNASAVFMAKSGDYGEEVPHRAELDAPVGRALGPTAEQNGTSAAPNSGCWVREFSHAVVAVNANKGPGLPNSPLLVCSLFSIPHGFRTETCTAARSRARRWQSHLMTQRSFCEGIEWSGSSNDEAGSRGVV